MIQNAQNYDVFDKISILQKTKNKKTKTKKKHKCMNEMINKS